MRKLRLALVIAALPVFAAITSCSSKREAPLATLGNRAIREGDFQSYLKSVHPPEKVAEINRESSERSRALAQYLDDLAIAAKARREGIDRQPRFGKAVELMEVKTLAHLVTERYRDQIVRDSQASAAEVQGYYEQHQDQFSETPRFTARHLLVYVKGNPAFPEKGLADAAARAKAKEALAKLRSGRSWDEVTKAYSDELATRQRGGLLHDAQFGYFAPEVERAVRTQALGKPGEVVKTVFGYHVLEVESRITEGTPKPFEEVKGVITERLSQQRSVEARKAFMTPLWAEVGFAMTEAGKRPGNLLDDNAVALHEILAVVAGRNILEADFRWFLKDAFIPQQRQRAYSRPGARQSMLESFLDMSVLAAKARKDGMDRTPDFAHTRVLMEQDLLAEFMQERDKAGPFCQQCGQTDEERQLAQRKYFERVRAEVGLELAGAPNP
jgi:peptidyl-prolyl cis-trans isomerase C